MQGEFWNLPVFPADLIYDGDGNEQSLWSHLKSLSVADSTQAEGKFVGRKEPEASQKISSPRLCVSQGKFPQEVPLIGPVWVTCCP